MTTESRELRHVTLVCAFASTMLLNLSILHARTVRKTSLRTIKTLQTLINVLPAARGTLCGSVFQIPSLRNAVS